MTEVLSVIIRTILMLLALLIVTRILGRRTLSELTFYDFVIGLVIGNISATVITDTEFSLQDGAIILVVSTAWVLALNELSQKSITARKLIEAEPLIVLHNGKILEDHLKKRFYNVNDLLEMLRQQGIFDPQQVELALIEADGQLSVLKKQAFQNPTFQDLNLSSKPKTQTSVLTGKELIINGKIIEHNLEKSGLTITELKNLLSSTGMTDLTAITVAMITPEGKLYVDYKQDDKT